MKDLLTQARAVEARLREKYNSFHGWEVPDTISSLITALEAAQANKPFQPDWVNYHQGYANGKAEALMYTDKCTDLYLWLIKQKASPSTTPYGECTLTFDVEGEARHAWGRALEEGKGMTACIDAAIKAQGDAK